MNLYILKIIYYKKRKLCYFKSHEAFFKDKMRHRLNGPAMTFEDGEQKWYQYNELHRDDGPAIIRDYCEIIRDYCEKEYWIDGYFIKWIYIY